MGTIQPDSLVGLSVMVELFSRNRVVLLSLAGAAVLFVLAFLFLRLALRISDVADVEPKMSIAVARHECQSITDAALRAECMRRTNTPQDIRKTGFAAQQ